MIKIRRILRKIYNKNVASRLNNNDFSIIASNCNGTFLLHDLGMKFNSPFVNLWMKPDDFIKFLKDNYHGKKVGIVAHRAPQLAFEVLTKNISWEEANRNDWRKAKAWQPGWEYIIK